MNLALFKPLWGHEGNSEAAVAQAVEAAFDGLEGPVPVDVEQRRAFVSGLKEAGLDYIAEITTGGGYVPDPAALPSRHLDDLRKRLELSLEAEPIFINTQTGLDAWSLPEQMAYFEAVLELEAEFGIPISVETHRSRSTYSPWVTWEIAKELPTLRFTLDFSHWCCVAERLVMNDDADQLAFFADRAWHIHARVGYDQGPQVPDPRAPEYQREVAAHLDWWRVLWQAQRERGFSRCTMTPEFGTDGYLHLEPFTRKPVANLWEINCWMATRLIDAFTEWQGSDSEIACG